MVVGLVDANAPKFSLNPNVFGPFDLESIELRREGVGEGIRYDTHFPSGPGTARAYIKLAELVDRNDSGTPFGVTYEEWRTKCTLYGFDFTADLQHNSAFHLFQGGSLTLVLKFRTALAKRVKAIVYKEYDDLIEIDAARNVKMIGSAL